MFANRCRSLIPAVLCAACLAVSWPAADLFADSRAVVVVAQTAGPLYRSPYMAQNNRSDGETLQTDERYRVLTVKGNLTKIKSLKTHRVFWARTSDLAPAKP